MSLMSWISGKKPLPVWCRRLSGLFLQGILWCAGLTVVAAVLVSIMIQDPQGMSVRLWLENARFPLLAWRLMLYAVLAGGWAGGIRARFAAQLRANGKSLSSLFRLEAMVTGLIALSEYNVWLAPR
ncbi:hypothetical protein EJH27_01805 [Salmonella enterica subsp. enterica serovar Virchow]|nr:hypothetical protein [Salmonella enterica subsp. enterica serovar Virchow]